MYTSDIFRQDGTECRFSSSDRAFDEMHLIHYVSFH